jgi:hypothetical protein
MLTQQTFGQAIDALKHSPEYMQKLLQNCEDELAKATAALKAIFDCTDPYADGAPDASDHDKLCNEVSALARPWARGIRKETANDQAVPPLVGTSA